MISIDSHNIEAMKYRALHFLCRQGNYDETAQILRDLYTEMDSIEPNNATLFVHMAQLFSRLVSSISLASSCNCALSLLNSCQ